MTGNAFYLLTSAVSNTCGARLLISLLPFDLDGDLWTTLEGSLSHVHMKNCNNAHTRLHSYPFTAGGEEGAPQSDPLFRLTSDGTMLSELLSTLETGDPNAPGDLTAPLFSDDTINAILAEQFRETAAQVALDMGQQPQQNQQPSATATRVQQHQPAAVTMQTAPSGDSTSSMMSLQEVTAAMQLQHQGQTQPLPHGGATTTIMTMPVSVQQQQQQQYLTLLDGKILHQADGSAVFASVPSGQQPLAVAMPGSTSVLQYIPVLNSQVVNVPPLQVQAHPTAVQQEQQQQQQQLAAMAAATLSSGCLSGDGSGPVLPTTSGSTTPPVTTPTSAAAANAAVYTSEISTTQQLVATAAAQQQWLQQEAANAANAGMDATNAANVALREATAAVADMAQQNSFNNSITTSSEVLVSGQISPRTMAMPPPPPRAPRRSLDAGGNTTTVTTMPLQPPSLTPQLRPATTEPFPKSLASAVLAAAQGGNDYTQQQQHALGASLNVEAPAPQPAPLLRPALVSGEIPEDGQLPRKPSHKRERSLRSACPTTADPTTAPTIKCAKGHSNGDEGTCGGVALSPNSLLLTAAVAASTGGSSGDLSPLNGIYTEANAMPEPPLAPHYHHHQQQQPSVSAPESSTRTADANNSADGHGAAAAGSFEVEDDVMALIQAALAPKAGGKRRGRPPGSRAVPMTASGAAAAGANEPREPTDAEILESLIKEDPTRRQLPVDEIKKLVRKEKNRISAAVSRTRTANYTAALESRVKALQAEQAELSGWLQAPPQELPHRVLLVGPTAAAAAAGDAVADAQSGRPPIRHLSL
jgi:hypothetical protein